MDYYTRDFWYNEGSDNDNEWYSEYDEETDDDYDCDWPWNYNKQRDRLLREHLFWPLIKEIDELKKTLCELVAADPNFTIRIEYHIKRIKNAIPSNPEDISCFIKDSPCEEFRDIYCPYPLSRLLYDDELDHQTKIPLDIFKQFMELLVTAGFDINGGFEGNQCLYAAIDSSHYDAVRWLVECGADCNVTYGDDTPISYIASDVNVPLDLFDLLKTSENLNDGTDRNLPLHEALYEGHISSALYLISLGAEVDKTDGHHKCLPIMRYIQSAGRFNKPFKFHEELFIKLIPPHCMDIATIMCEIFQTNVSKKLGYDVMSNMVYPLLQRLVIVNNVDVPQRLYEANRFHLEDQDECRVLYLNSLLALLLDLDVTEMPDIEEIETSIREETQRQALVGIWKAYHQRHGSVKSLFKLCINCIRKSMSSLDDSSFQSLPVPSKLRNSLMLCDVAEVVCEAWKLWPICLPIADIMNNC